MKAQKFILGLFLSIFLVSCISATNNSNPQQILPTRTLAEDLEIARPIIAKILTIIGLLLSSAGMLGSARLEKIERLNRKIRRRIKFSVFFYSSRPVAGKFFFYSILISYLIMLYALFIPSEFQAEFLAEFINIAKENIVASIIMPLSLIFGLFFLLIVLYLLIKHKNPKQTYLAINSQISSFINQKFGGKNISIKYLIIFFPFTLLFFFLYLYSIFIIWYFWIIQNIYSFAFTFVTYLLLLPYKLLEIFRIKAKLRGSIVTVGVLIGILGVLLD